MSSFEHPHSLYLFEMSNGRKKLAYGISPEDALAVLSWRLTEEEMALIDPTRFTRVKQRDLQSLSGQLG
jgi:hypothetical protein